SFERLQRRIGSEYYVVIDEVSSEGAIARSYAEAPEIDGVIHINDFFNVSVGDRLWVEIIHADEHDLWAVPSQEAS
ncbi:MAG: 30S ribosomal protein S12 methylthiotransferase RimO, partial [Pseudomonadota bacterium]